MYTASTGWEHSYRRTARLGATPPAGPFAWYLTNQRREFVFVVFDLDPGRHGREAVERDVDELAGLLYEADLRYLVCESGPGGGVHIWVPVEPVAAAVVRAIARAAKRLLPTLDISPLTNAATGCVRPPGAPHRHGGYSTPVDQWTPITPEAAARVLSVPNDAEAIERLAVLLDAAEVDPREVEAEAVRTIEKTPRGLRLAGRRRPCDVADLLAEAPAAARGHAHLRKILVRLALARWSLPEAALLLLANVDMPGLIHLARQGGGRSRTRSPGEQAALLARQWDRAVEYAAAVRRPGATGAGDERQAEDEQAWAARLAEVVAVVGTVREAIAAEPRRWTTQAGPSDRRALEYVSELALDAVSTEIEIDCRRLAEATGMGKSTAARSLDRLCLDEWLHLVEAGRGQRASRYRLLRQVLEDAAPSSSASQHQSPSREEARGGGGTQGNPPPSADLRPTLTLRDQHRTDLRRRREIVSHDLFTHPGPDQPGLGRHVASTLAVLSGGVYKVKDLAQITGYGARTIRRHLTILDKHGIAAQSHRPPGWRRTRASLTGAARRLEAHGTRERRHRAYALDRQLYAWWLAELDWMKTRGKRTARGRAVPGQGRLILPGAPSYANRARYPRDHRGRADHRAARVHLQLAAAARRAAAA
ncbi:hypothetical protein [Nonomuraea rhodomycinica]|uniref:Uncharacterized protein n=1 Tax=Nonomuraea rhodomycinica TaxID=1712872 RepID=A0A7Y6IZ72_9ACTN|nr:hypothetical protein [Nonomuraea rhodomycinica]NUW47017.1 hypothetical protein [Nonomuraea rhodomycinica]